jgi:hypothetical protein
MDRKKVNRKEPNMKFIKTCEMDKIYPETAKAFNLHGVYHHFIDGDKTVSYPVKSEAFKTIEMCIAEYSKTQEVA